MKKSALQEALKKIGEKGFLCKDHNKMEAYFIPKTDIEEILQQMELDMLEEFRNITDEIFKID